MPTIQVLRADRAAVRAALRSAGVASKTLLAIETKALKTGRKTTGQWKTNRDNRWTLSPGHPQYASEEDCLTIELRLLGMMCEFRNAPSLKPDVKRVLRKYIGHMPRPGSYRDALTLHLLDYNEFASEASAGTPGDSAFHIGHEDPTLIPKHVPGNVSWREKRSNLIQGNMTLTESRTALVELIARYFQLGEVSIHPD